MTDVTENYEFSIPELTRGGDANDVLALREHVVNTFSCGMDFGTGQYVEHLCRLSINLLLND